MAHLLLVIEYRQPQTLAVLLAKYKPKLTNVAIHLYARP